jgi:hypothetical protein
MEPSARGPVADGVIGDAGVMELRRRNEPVLIRRDDGDSRVTPRNVTTDGHLGLACDVPRL